MRTLQQLLDAKRRPLVSVGPDDLALHALGKLAEHDIGAVLVLQDGKLAGILSERDCVRKLELVGRNAATTPVKDLMSSRVQYVTPDQTVDQCMGLMTERKIRHLPVLDGDGQVLGILSIGDMVKATLDAQAFTIAQLTEYITG